MVRQRAENSATKTGKEDELSKVVGSYLGGGLG